MRRWPRRRSSAARRHITTQISAQETAPGAQITDTVNVTGLGKLAATVNVELWGPFPTRDAISCEGTPVWTGTLPVPGDGTYITAPVTLAAAGYYTYRESIAESESMAGTVTACGEVDARPRSPGRRRRSRRSCPTRWSSPTAEIFDRLTVTGLGRRPRPSRSTCSGRTRAATTSTATGAPYWSGEVAVDGRRHVSSPRRRPSGAPGSSCSASGSRPRRPSPPPRASASSRPRRRWPRR